MSISKFITEKRGIRWQRLFSLVTIGILIGGALLGLFLESLQDFKKGFLFNENILRITTFTIFQGILSTIFSVMLAIPTARAFARHQKFKGRTIILRLFTLPLALPQIIGTLGILSILGVNGIFAGFLAWGTGMKWSGIYGTQGIIIGHIFFNMPLAVRFFLGALETISPNHWRLANQIGMPPKTIFFLLEWPAIRSALSQASSLIFVLCITSFTIVLILGGGPSSTTLEVAIYQSLRFDFNLPQTITLTLMQIILTLTVVLIMRQIGQPMIPDPASPIIEEKTIRVYRSETWMNFTIIFLATTCVASPILAVLTDSLGSDFKRLLDEKTVILAIGRSLLFSFLSASICLFLAWPLIQRKTLHNKKRGTTISLILAVPSVVIGAGWFILLHPWINILAAAPVLIIGINSIMAIPFVTNIIQPAYNAVSERYDHLSTQLGIHGYNQFRLILWPNLYPYFLKSFLFAMILSLGDLGTAALFGSESTETLPLLLLSRMGSYRTADTAGLALILTLLCIGIMMLIEKVEIKNER